MITHTARLADPTQDVLVHVRPYGKLSNLPSGGEYEELVREVAESRTRGQRLGVGARQCDRQP
jgi:hypothetical protein